MDILESECNQALEQIGKQLYTSEAIQIEQKLWKSIIKNYKENSNSMLINYFIGYYMTLHDILFFNCSSKDHFLKFSRYGFSLDNSNQELLYNIHIRLGDLYRYVDARENAKHYYQRALQIDPRRGNAYNQLALCTPLTKAYQCIYFSVRAYHSSIDPIKTAESNIKLSISRLDSPIFEKFRNISNVGLSENPLKIFNPDCGQDWFYLIVISIHFNDLNLSLNLLLDEILKMIDFNDLKSMNFDYVLMSLDVALDWILKDYNDLDDMSSIEYLKFFNSKFKINYSLKEEETNIALVHNLMLKDFIPLKNIYEKMEYYYEAENYKISKHRKILISRLIYKLQKF